MLDLLLAVQQPAVLPEVGVPGAMRGWVAVAEGVSSSVSLGVGRTEPITHAMTATSAIAPSVHTAGCATSISRRPVLRWRTR